MEIKRISEGVSFAFHKTERFKTSVVSVSLICPLDEKSSERALLCYLLARTNRSYPDIISMNRKLASLYGAVISPSVKKIGEAQVLTLSLVMVDDRFSLDGKAVSDEAIRLLMDCIFSPDITPDGFREENMEREKRLLIEKIESEKDEKRIYALNRMTEEMCRDESYGIHKFGKKERIAELSGKEIFAEWKKILTTCPVQINAVGSFDMDKVQSITSAYFDNLQRKKADIIEIRTEFLTESYGSNTVREKQSVKQGKLVIGMRAGMTFDFDNYPAIRLMTAIFGGGTFSKLFMNVREKMSLCYYCAARLVASKGIITVESGVETENAEKALAAIRNELDEVRKGNFTDETVENAKKSLVDSFNSVEDSVLGIEAFMESQCLSGTFRTPEEYAELLNNVSREEIVIAANMVTEDTVFILESEKEENE